MRAQLLVAKYLANKDVFLRHYRSALGRRLMWETSADNDKEELMVQYLRVRPLSSLFSTRLASGTRARPSAPHSLVW